MMMRTPRYPKAQKTGLLNDTHDLVRLEREIENAKQRLVNAQRWNKLVAEVRVHPECKERSLNYGFPYYSWETDEMSRKYNEENKSNCACCSDPLICGNSVKRHAYRELSQSEAQEKGILHFGRCYHVAECTSCGVVNAYDSSD